MIDLINALYKPTPDSVTKAINLAASMRGSEYMSEYWELMFKHVNMIEILGLKEAALLVQTYASDKKVLNKFVAQAAGNWSPLKKKLALEAVLNAANNPSQQTIEKLCHSFKKNGPFLSGLSVKIVGTSCTSPISMDPALMQVLFNKNNYSHYGIHLFKHLTKICAVDTSHKDILTAWCGGSHSFNFITELQHLSDPVLCTIVDIVLDTSNWLRSYLAKNYNDESLTQDRNAVSETKRSIGDRPVVSQHLEDQLKVFSVVES